MMTLLPVVDRELRVASRRKATYWTRVVAAGFWILIASAFLGIQHLANSPSFSMMAGHWLFLVLSWLAFFYTCSCGVFLTSDSLSEEKRDGTLGLLFLTDLRGFDVVLGKLSATSLQAFYALLAVFPIFALPFLLGGVTGELFGKTLLILINSLFLSLAAGIFISSISHDSQKAINGTLFLLMFLIPALLLFDWWRAGWNGTRFSPLLSFASPALSFIDAIQNRFIYFWPNLIVSHLVGWSLLIAASFCASRKWQQKTATEAKPMWRRFRSEKRARAERSSWLEINPALWLASRDRSASFYFKLILLLATVVLGIMCWSERSLDPSGILGFASGLGGFLSLLLMIWIAAQSSRYFTEAARSGALELLLCTPLTERSIVKGHWRALCRTFGFPLALTLSIQIITQIAQLERSSATSINGMDWNVYVTLQVTYHFFGTLLTAAALAWFGMWMGLTSKKPSIAVIKTFAFVKVIPLIVVAIAAIFIQVLSSFILNKIGTSKTMMMMLESQFVMFFFSAVADIVFIMIARRKLFSQFRAVVAGDFRATIQPSTVQPMPPPVIAT